jgi:hypothetical protein
MMFDCTICCHISALRVLYRNALHPFGFPEHVSTDGRYVYPGALPGRMGQRLSQIESGKGAGYLATFARKIPGNQEKLNLIGPPPQQGKPREC